MSSHRDGWWSVDLMAALLSVVCAGAAARHNVFDIHAAVVPHAVIPASAEAARYAQRSSLLMQHARDHRQLAFANSRFLQAHKQATASPSQTMIDYYYYYYYTC